MLLTACSTQVDEEDRLVYVKPAAVGKNVLLVDFTGQRCVNCPNATDIIEQLQKQYGPDTVVAVGMHSGPLGFKGNARVLGLATDLGDTYYNYWNIEYQPQGVIDYLGKSDYLSWTGIVAAELQKTAPVDIKLTATTDGSAVSGKVTVSGIDGATTGILQLWLVEDSITAMQMMPDGSANATYLHNHVFRAAINGDWGQGITVAEGTTEDVDYTLPLQTAWVTKHLSVIAFVYNTTGVKQVVRKHL